MSLRERTITNLIACFDSVADLCEGLDDTQWATQSLCPDWNVHGTLAHLAAIENVLIGWMPESAETPLPFSLAGELLAEAEELDGPGLLARYREIIYLRRPELLAVTDDEFDRPSITPVGPQTYGRFMAIRVFDFWMHEFDMRTPLGLEHDAGGDAAVGGDAAAQALEEIEGSMGYIVGKKVGLEDGRSISFHLTGPIEKQLHVAVDGRAASVPQLDNPDVTVTTDSLTFCQLAGGRIDPQGPIDDGRIRWEGNDKLGDRAARNLAFTM